MGKLGLIFNFIIVIIYFLRGNFEFFCDVIVIWVVNLGLFENIEFIKLGG